MVRGTDDVAISDRGLVKIDAETGQTTAPDVFAGGDVAYGPKLVIDAIQNELEGNVQEAVAVGSSWTLFSLAFVTVFREGVETVLFLTAAAFSSTPAQTLLGGSLGLPVAVALG